MRVQSIRAAIEIRDPAGNGLFGAPVQVPLGEVNRVTEADYFPQKIGPVAEALENSGHVLPSGLLPPLVVDRRHVAGGIRIFDQPDFGVVVGH